MPEDSLLMDWVRKVIREELENFRTSLSYAIPEHTHEPITIDAPAIDYEEIIRRVRESIAAENPTESTEQIAEQVVEAEKEEHEILEEIQETLEEIAENTEVPEGPESPEETREEIPTEQMESREEETPNRSQGFWLTRKLFGGEMV